MRNRGHDVTVAYYLREAPGLTRDDCRDFLTRDRLVDMSAAMGPNGVKILEELARIRDASILLQIGAPQAYRQLPYLKERIPRLRLLDMLYNPVGHTLNHFLFENAFDAVIVESVAMRDYIRANSSKKWPSVHLALSGIDLEEFAPLNRQAIVGDHLTLGYMGRLSAEKNPLAFVELAERLHEVFPTINYRIYGEGAMEAELRARIAQCTNADKVVFCGYAPHARDALSEIDVLFVPSKVDGRPNAIMEASACGVPTIAAPVGGIPELIEDGVNGYLVAPNDYNSIAGIVGRWLSDRNELANLSHLSRVKAEREFDKRTMLDRYSAIFESEARSGQSSVQGAIHAL